MELAGVNLMGPVVESLMARTVGFLMGLVEADRTVRVAVDRMVPAVVDRTVQVVGEVFYAITHAV